LSSEGTIAKDLFINTISAEECLHAAAASQNTFSCSAPGAGLVSSFVPSSASIDVAIPRAATV